MSKVKVQAREIARFVKRNHIRMYPGSYGDCAAAVVGRMIGYSYDDYQRDHTFTAHPSWGEAYFKEVARRSGRTYEDLKGLEAGYEKRIGTERKIYEKNRYFKVGQRLALMVPSPW